MLLIARQKAQCFGGFVLLECPATLAVFELGLHSLERFLVDDRWVGVLDNDRFVAPKLRYNAATATLVERK